MAFIPTTKRKGPTRASVEAAIAALPKYTPPTSAITFTTPGIPTPPVQPFLTANDILQIANLDFNAAQSQADVDRQLADLQTDTKYAKTQIEDSSRKSTAAAAENAAARGVFQSSIKDSALYDIAAQKVIRQGQLDDRLHTAQLDAQNRKRIIQRNLDAAAEAMRRQAVENANAQNQDQPPWVQEPSAVQVPAMAGSRPVSGVGRPPAPPAPPAPPKAPFGSYYSTPKPWVHRAGWG